jgi:TolB-like protein/tetratricopeptide (TPR) repeat protein
MAFFQELKRRNVVKTGMLYLVSSWLILQVADLLFDLVGLPATWLRLVLVLLALGFPLVLIFSWAYEITPEGLRREKDVDRSLSQTSATGRKIDTLIAVLLVVAILAVGVDRLIPERSEMARPESGGPATSNAAADAQQAETGVAGGETATPPPSRSIAVLPFTNMSNDPENEYFADGLSEEILNFLADVPDLRVTARTSSFQFKDRNLDIREVAAALNVAHVLEGSVRRAGNRARVAAQLIRASDGYHLWSETYDRTLDDVFHVQTDVAENVTEALGVVMDERQRQRMREVGVRDVEAFIDYQRATRMFFDAHSNQIDMDMLRESADLYTQAIEREPRFAAAYHMRSDYPAHVMTMLGPSPEERAQAAARHADDLDNAVRYARSPQARALMEVDRVLVSSNWRDAPRQMDEALAGTTCDEGTWVEVAPVFGLAEAYLDRSRRMIECDPLNFYNYYSESTVLLWMGRPAEAYEAARRGLARAPDHPFLDALIVKALLQQGRVNEALESAEAISSWAGDNAVATVLAAKGEVAQARRMVDRIVAEAGPWQEMYLTVLFAAVLGDRAAANEAAAWYDGLPGGPLMLSGMVLECLCGAPFDLSETPEFAARLAEAGVDWPPPVRIDYPAMRQGAGQP